MIDGTTRTDPARRLRAITLALALSGVAAASAADGDAPFTEEAVARGLSYVPVYGGTSGHGVALPDLDGDGDPDVVLTGAANGLVAIYENDGTGHFIPRSLGSGMPALDPEVASGVIAGDIDGDGDLDLYFINFGPNVLMRNDGDFEFTNVTALAGVGDDGFGTGGGWADFDLDGDLDLYVGNLRLLPDAPPNRLFRNHGDGTFEEIGADLGVDDPSSTWQMVFVDYDGDADADIYISNDKGHLDCEDHNYLFRNDRGVFTDVTDRSNTHACADSMGVAVGDFDGNGHVDLYCTNIPAGNPLLLNQGDGTFVEGADDAGVGSYRFGWGAHFFDYDNDGTLDLYVCNFNDHNGLYSAEAGWPCPDQARAMGVDEASNSLSYCLAAADIDDDGDIDLLMQNDNTNVRLFVNHAGSRRSWVKWRIAGRPGHDPFAVGTRVRARTGATWRMRDVQAGGNFKSQDHLVVHLGLGAAETVDEVVVTWPGGVTRTLTGVPARETWTVHPPERLGDADGDGDADLGDFAALRACAAAGFGPGCEVMDLDGNSTIDLADAEGFATRFAGAQLDCDGNGRPDLVDLFDGTLPDRDGDGLPDGCEATYADFNGDARVDILDLLGLIARWGECPRCAEDLDGDGRAGVFELEVLVSAWTR